MRAWRYASPIAATSSNRAPSSARPTPRRCARIRRSSAPISDSDAKGNEGLIDPTIDAEYNIRRRHPESPTHYAHYTEDSARARAALTAELDVAYGERPAERLDLFPASRPNSPVLVFIHGGYWRALDKNDFSFIAPAFVAAGIGVALINYDLTPRVTVETIVTQSQR